MMGGTSLIYMGPCNNKASSCLKIDKNSFCKTLPSETWKKSAIPNDRVDGKGVWVVAGGLSVNSCLGEQFLLYDCQAPTYNVFLLYMWNRVTVKPLLSKY